MVLSTAKRWINIGSAAVFFSTAPLRNPITLAHPEVDMSLVPSLVSNVPTVSANTAGLLSSAVAAEAAPQVKGNVAVELAATLRAGMEGVTQSTEVVTTLADPGPAAVGRFATTRRTSAPPQKNTGGDHQAEAKDKDTLLELFADARPEVKAAVGRLSGGLSRTQSNQAGEERVGRFMPQILPRPRRAAVMDTPMQTAFADGIGRFQPSVGRLSGALQR